MERDPEAVAPVLGVLLMVAITVVVAAVVFAMAQGFSSERDDPRITMVKDDNGSAPGGFLTVVSITNGPLPMDGLLLGGSSQEADACQWSRLAGDLQVGDQLACPAPGTLTISDTVHKVLLYSGRFE